MGLIRCGRLDAWFAEQLQGLNCTAEAIAYVIGVLGRQHWDDADLSAQSVLLAYQHAQFISDFASFQRVGDWVLWVDAVFPEHVALNRHVTLSVGQQAYHSCHRLLRGQWRVYEELADELPLIAAKVHRKLV